VIRVLSGLVLVSVFVAAIWFCTPPQLLVIAEIVLALAFFEYAALVAEVGAPVPRLVTVFGAGAVCAAVAWPGVPLDVPLMTVILTLSVLAVSMGQIGPHVLTRLFAAVFGVLYLGLPMGAFVAVHALAGRQAVLLLFLTIAVSDTAQLCSGRLFGRHLMTPTISPKKTVEGAIGGAVFGTAAMVIAGHWWLPGVGPGWLVGLGLIVVTFGMLGDLFESVLKRTAGVKDSSRLIPGHGGMLDRIDAFLFATPAYYVFLRYALR
jgi:phosphatidate cytidylyltransferase